MKSIEIVFTRSKKTLPIGSWLIRLWTWKSYSHVCLKKKLFGEIVYFQANDNKVNYEHKSIFEKKHKIIKTFKIPVSDKVEISLNSECIKQAGKPYAFMQNLGILIVDILALINIKIKNPWKQGKNCSELIYSQVLKKLFQKLKENPDTIKPHHIEKILISKGYQPK